MGLLSMDFKAMGARVAATARRRSVLTKKSNMNSDASGAPRVRDSQELVEHLEASYLNAVLVEVGEESGWAAVFQERQGGPFEVARVPTSVKENILGKQIPDAASAVAAAMQL